MSRTSFLRVYLGRTGDRYSIIAFLCQRLVRDAHLELILAHAWHLGFHNPALAVLYPSPLTETIGSLVGIHYYSSRGVTPLYAMVSGGHSDYRNAYRIALHDTT